MESMQKKPEKKVEILINGQSVIVDKESLTFQDIVKLAFGVYEDNPNTVYTIIYFKGHSDKPKGELVIGESLKVKDGMIINVTKTDKS